MMNPLLMRSLMMDPDEFRANQRRDDGIITVEEAIDCREANSRFFSLINRESKLNVIVSRTSTIIGCQLDGHEIVVNQRLLDETHESWAIGDRPYQKMNVLLWNCHVRGAELLLSSGPSTVMYELTRDNTLNTIVKLRTIHLQPQVTYFNLKNAKNKTSVDGHTLVVQCNANMNRIQAQPTKLLCQCNKSASILPQSLVGDIPFELVRKDIAQPPTGDQNTTDDDIIICDATYSLESTCPLDVLRIQLRYLNRCVTFETRSSHSPTSTTNSNQQQANVTPSTASRPGTSKAHSHTTDAPVSSAQICPSSSSAPSQSSESKSQNKWFSTPPDSASANRHSTPPGNSAQSASTAAKDSSRQVSAGSNLASCSSSTSSNLPTQTSNSSASVASYPTAILRVRVRVTNFGVAIMPLMMTNYNCTYKFTW